MNANNKKPGRPKGLKYPEKISIPITSEMRKRIKKKGEELGFNYETDIFRFAIEYFLNNYS